MTIQDELLWLEERLRAMDPTINLNDGSPANIQVLQPFLRRFQPDPLESDIISFIIGRLRQEYPNISAEEGDAFIDLVVKPMSILLEPFRREIRSVKRNKSIADPSVLNTDEADAILANTFFTRSAGAYSRGKIRLYFVNPVTLSLGSANVGYTADGLRFIITTAQSITTSAMMLNVEGSLYYWDVDYVAEGTGKNYDIGPNQIIGVTGIASATKATNPYKFTGGVTEESVVDIVARAEESIGERSLNTVPGAVAKLFEEFGELKILQIIGFNDSEMQRDIVTGGGLGSALHYGTNALVTDDGDGYGSYVDVATGIDFTTEFGPAGTDISDYKLIIWLNIGGVVQPRDYTLGEVVGSTRISINSSYTNDARIPAPVVVPTYWSIRKYEITLSDIPGGILFPDTDGNELSIEPNQIHIGGCSDYYVNGATQTELDMPLEVITDRSPIVKGTIVSTYDGTTKTADVVDVVMTEDEYDEVTAGTAMLRVIDTASGNNLGTYLIVSKVSYTVTYGTFVISEDLVAPEETSVFGEITDDIDVELNNPYEVVLSGSDLRTYAGAAIVDTAAVTNFTDYGMTVGSTDNKLIILSGNDAGTYDINSVAATVLTLASSLTDTAGPIPYRVVREMSESAIDLPIRRIKSIELLDSSGSPSGNYLPYKHPIDVQSRRFANIGREPKAGYGTLTDDTLTMTAASTTVASSDITLNYWNLGVRQYDLVNVNQGNNQGYYLVTGVGGGPAPIGTGLLSYQLRLSTAMRWTESGKQYQVGEPSVGSFRLYFLDPCSISVTAASTLFSTTISGTAYRFRPDPTVNDQYLPTDTTVPTVSMTTPSTVLSMYTPDGATGIRGWNYGVSVGDYVEITYAPIIGVVDMSVVVAGLSGKSILVDLGSGSERVTFAATGTLSGAEIVSQINAQLSTSIASLYNDAGTPRLMLRADMEITLKDNSAAPGAGDATLAIMGAVRATYMPWLAGSYVGQDTSNESHVKDKWAVVAVNPTAGARNEISVGINLSGTSFSQAYTIPSDRGHYIRLSHVGIQRISSVEMEDNQDSLGLYYWDVECTSEGHGDSWNIEPDLQGTATGYVSDGWEMSVEDDTVSYSMAEEPWISISPRVLLSGDDDLASFTTMVEESVQVSYEQEDIVEAIHSFVRSPSERVVNNNPLVRGLTPTMVRASISYSGGYTETKAREKLVELVESIKPSQQLEISDMVQILTDSGASFVTLPITLIGISHGVDRSITVERSQNYISNDRLSVLVPDDDGTTVEGASYIQLNRS